MSWCRGCARSFWVIAPLLARTHEAKVSLPGGCAIGTRPVDLLIMALEELGADLTIDGGYVVPESAGGLKGAMVDFPKVTVSGTHVALMAATLARVRASSPISPPANLRSRTLPNCLNGSARASTPAPARRVRTSRASQNRGTRHTVLPDRIEAGTYAMAVAMTGATCNSQAPARNCCSLRSTC